jgi:alpha-L-fucosidase
MAKAAVIEEAPTDRAAWFRDAKFGMFIHWGVYSCYGGVYNGRNSARYAEWILHNENIPLDDYEAVARDFTPEAYDPEAWAQAALEAGVKYVVITSKHHDGFALFPSAYSKWSIADHSRWGNDLIEPLAEACRKRGIRFGLYYSHAIDWVNGGAQSEPKFKAAGRTPIDYDHYLNTISLPQTKEILERYQPDILWWDMPSGMNAERAKPFADLLEKKYPRVLTNSRLGGGYDGDFGTYEQSIPAAPQLDRLWESCMTMNHTWGYRSTDHEWKSVEQLLHNLIGSVAKGGNFLLNVGPDGKGNIPQASLDRMAEIGKWLQVNGESIYGTGPTPFLFQQAYQGTATQRKDGENTLIYLHVFKWPSNGELRVNGVKNIGCSAELLLEKGKALPISQDDSGLTIRVPKNAPGNYSDTVVLRVPGKPVIENDSFFVTADGVQLNGLDADIKGPKPRRDMKNNFIEHISEQTELSWMIDVPEPGKYLLSGAVGATADRNMKMSMAGQELQIMIPDSHVAHYGGGNFPQATLAIVEVARAGRHALCLKPSGNWGEGVALKHLNLKPVKLHQDERGNIELPALASAEIQGSKAAIVGGAIRSPEKVSWDLLITREAGTFEVVVDYNSDQPITGELRCGTSTLPINLPSTGGGRRRLVLPAGKIAVGASGKNRLVFTGDLKRLTLFGLHLYINNELEQHRGRISTFPLARAEVWDTKHSDTERWKPQHAVDGDPATGWQVPFINKERPQILEVDLGEEREVNHLSLDTNFDEAWHNIQEASLEVMDGKSWRKVADVREAGRGYELDFPEVHGRLFRLVISKCNMIHIHQLVLEKH